MKTFAIVKDLKGGGGNQQDTPRFGLCLIHSQGFHGGPRKLLRVARKHQAISCPFMSCFHWSEWPFPVPCQSLASPLPVPCHKVNSFICQSSRAGQSLRSLLLPHSHTHPSPLAGSWLYPVCRHLCTLHIVTLTTLTSIIQASALGPWTS